MLFVDMDKKSTIHIAKGKNHETVAGIAKDLEQHGGSSDAIIQAAKAKAHGFRTLRKFRLIVFSITGKLNFSLVNSTLCQNLRHYLF